MAIDQQPPGPGWGDPPGGYPPGYGSPYGQPYPVYVPPTSGLAVASLICSLAGLVTLGLGSIPGVILGHMALPETRSGMRGGHGLAVAGLVVGYLQVASWALFWAFTGLLGVAGSA